jgi:hypothetical protein
MSSGFVTLATFATFAQSFWRPKHALSWRSNNAEKPALTWLSRKYYNLDKFAVIKAFHR